MNTPLVYLWPYKDRSRYREKRNYVTTKPYLFSSRFIYGPFKDLTQINSTADIEKKVTSVETWSTTVKLFSLEPNTQYIAYIEAVSTKTNQVRQLRD